MPSKEGSQTVLSNRISLLFAPGMLSMQLSKDFILNLLYTRSYVCEVVAQKEHQGKKAIVVLFEG